MLCKYYLQLGRDTIDTENPDCMDVSSMIKNLDSIKVSYQRVDLGGVVRKCGSSIEFTGKAHDAIIAHYEENYLKSKGVFAVYMADNNWNYSKVWECPLDFASLQYDTNVVTIGCVDNSAAAIIKAGKKSKYEFDVMDLKEPSDLLYDGVETVRTFYFRVIGSSGTQPNSDPTAMYEAVTTYMDAGGNYSLYIPGISVETADYGSELIELRDQTERGFYDGSESDMQDEGLLTKYACEGDNAGFLKCKGDCTVHISMNMTFSTYTPPEWSHHYTCMQFNLILVAGSTVMWRRRISYGDNPVNIDMDIALHAGEKIAFVISCKCLDYNYIWNQEEHSFINDYVYVKWWSNTHVVYDKESHYIANPIAFNIVKPVSLLRRLATEMLGKHGYYAECSIEGVGLVSRTLLAAAESIRMIPTNKIYTSFTDFCKFMEVVFGYIYTLEDAGYSAALGKRVVMLTFKHRSGAFRQDVVKRLSRVNGMSYMIDDGMIYSDIEVGYAKKDYDNGNSAMDEYNFTNYYKTDVDLKDDTLSLLSPYRADCYGIEELLVKNGNNIGHNNKESTESDNDIFIVIASASGATGGYWRIDRSVSVVNSSSGRTVFNAAIAPNKIVSNNEEYIGASAGKLSFTSSDGNSGAVIGGVPMSGDISLTRRLFSAGKISVDTDDHDLPESWDGIIEFEYEGKTYRGYIDSIDVCFARPGSITYNLIETCSE